jgi:hypothetical protein
MVFLEYQPVNIVEIPESNGLMSWGLLRHPKNSKKNEI